MQILKVIALLMTYPSAELQAGRDELRSAINEAQEIPPASRTQLNSLADEICEMDLMDAQAVYGSLFDRGRSLSLLLFEHVHGESRDRGQAMVDLMAHYEAAGFNINVRELPDYLPLYLEFLSTQDDLDARVGVADVNEILGTLSARLQERGSPYSCLFDALLIIAGVEVPMNKLLEIARKEERDDTPEAIDKVWEEEAVTFGNTLNTGGQGGGCGMNAGQPPMQDANADQPVKWVSAEQFTQDSSHRPDSNSSGSDQPGTDPNGGE